MGARESLENINKMENFMSFGRWMKGKNNVFICLGYGIMHATLEGYPSSEIRGYCYEENISMARGKL
jgi:hypothetical protein